MKARVKGRRNDISVQHLKRLRSEKHESDRRNKQKTLSLKSTQYISQPQLEYFTRELREITDHFFLYSNYVDEIEKKLI